MFRANPVILGTYLVIYRTNSVIFRTNTVKFRTNIVIFRTNLVIFLTNSVIFNTNPVNAVWVKMAQVYFSEMRSGVKMGSPFGFLCHTY